MAAGAEVSGQMNLSENTRENPTKQDEENEETDTDKEVSYEAYLQAAKEKLEELRIIHIEENVSLILEMEHADTQERKAADDEDDNTNNDMDKVAETEKMAVHKVQNVGLGRKIRGLEEEHKIVVEINTMQDKEIMRLKVELKDEHQQQSTACRHIDCLMETVQLLMNIIKGIRAIFKTFSGCMTILVGKNASLF